MGSKALNKYWLKALFCCLPAVLLFSCKVIFNSVTSWTVTHQASLFMRFSRQEYWSVLPFPPPGDLPDPGIKPTSSALADGFFTTEPPGKPYSVYVPILTIAIFYLPFLRFAFCICLILNFSHVFLHFQYLLLSKMKTSFQGVQHNCHCPTPHLMNKSRQPLPSSYSAQ